MTSRFHDAVAAIDAANAADPTIVTVRGVEGPKELRHAELMTEWVRRLRPDASDELLLAARGHHVCRWTVPRSSYPDGRAGYLRWRRDLHDVHAERVGEILGRAGYDAATVARVQTIVRKRNLAGDADVQTLEDALCLVFLETQFAELAARTERDKMIDIVRKTLGKMSDEGKRYARAMPLSAEHTALVEAALSPT